MSQVKKIIGLHAKTEHGKTTFEKVVDSNYKGSVCKIAFADELKKYCALITNLPLSYFYHCKNYEWPAFTSISVNDMVEKLFDSIHKIVPDKVSDKEQLRCILEKACKDVFSNRALKFDINFGNNKSFKEDMHIYLEGYTAGIFLQLFGTNIIRNYIDSDFWVKVVKKKINETSCSLVLVTDVRFTNEQKIFSTEKIHLENSLIENSLTVNSVLLRIERPEIIINSRDPKHISETALDDVEMFTMENYGTVAEYKEKVRTLVQSENIIEEIQKLEYRKSKFSL